VRSAFGVVPAEFYGQTEANLLLSNQPDAFAPQIGSMGRAVYGHRVRLVNNRDEAVEVGEQGEIVVDLPDPVAFLGYWNKPEATEQKMSGGSIHTGDLAVQDEQGNFYFVARSDDVINSSGYRMGPTEIEAAILSHPQISMAAVIGKPDPIRGEIVKAFVVPVSPVPNKRQITEEIQNLVRKKLGAHEYPREVAFVESLPMTTTGKIQRRILREQERPKP
jgi:acetyl-CoA synthetase